MQLTEDPPSATLRATVLGSVVEMTRRQKELPQSAFAEDGAELGERKERNQQEGQNDRQNKDPVERAASDPAHTLAKRAP
jgi:hypothetical protein